MCICVYFITVVLQTVHVLLTSYCLNTNKFIYCFVYSMFCCLSLLNITYKLCYILYFVFDMHWKLVKMCSGS
jgi:hypothetical protein